MTLENKSQLSRKGFTIIEILTVIAILAILGGIGFGTFIKISQNAKSDEAKTKVKYVANQLQVLVDREGLILPDGDGSVTSSHELYILLSGDTNGDGKYDDGEGEPAFPEVSPLHTGGSKYAQKVDDTWVLVDPWLQPLRYRTSGPDLKNNAEGGFDLWSIGPDGKDGTEDEREDNLNSW